MTCRRDWLPKEVPKMYFNFLKATPVNTRSKVARFEQPIIAGKNVIQPRNLVGKSAWNSVEFCNYSNSRPFELWNFHQNFIFSIVKCVPANSEHIPAGSECSPTIDSSNFMNQKMFPLNMSLTSGITF
jgi:hypothetical protein